jgi:hypothetical protein
MRSREVVAPLSAEEIARHVATLTRPLTTLADVARSLTNNRSAPISIKGAQIPMAHIPAVRRELQAALVQAGADDLGKALAVMDASFKWPQTIRDPNAYMTAMAQELKRYPVNVLIKAISSARRTEEWVPAITTMVKLCDKEMRLLRSGLRSLDEIAERHLLEKQHDEERAEQARLDRQERLELENLYYAKIGRLPDGDFSAAWEAIRYFFRQYDQSKVNGWKQAIKDGEQTICVPTRFLATIGRALLLAREKQIDMDQFGNLLSMEEHEAHLFIDGVYKGNIVCGKSNKFEGNAYELIFDTSVRNRYIEIYNAEKSAFLHRRLIDEGHGFAANEPRKFLRRERLRRD